MLYHIDGIYARVRVRACACAIRLVVPFDSPVTVIESIKTGSHDTPFSPRPTSYIAVIADCPLLRPLLAVIDSGVNAPSLDSYPVVLLARISDGGIEFFE